MGRVKLIGKSVVAIVTVLNLLLAVRESALYRVGRHDGGCYDNARDEVALLVIYGRANRTRVGTPQRLARTPVSFLALHRVPDDQWTSETGKSVVVQED